MSQIPLRPTASPVDTFAAPEVRAKSSNANQLAQLAQAMGGFNANLQEVSAQLAKEEREKTLKKVQSDVFNKRIVNKAQFNDAVKRGEISWADSPYAMEFADMLVAREEVGQLMLGLDSELENNKDMRFKSISEIDSYVKDRVREVSAGRSDSATGAMLAEAERHYGRILDKHENRLRKDRELQTQLGFTKEITRLSNEMQSAVSDGNISDIEAADIVNGREVTNPDGTKTVSIGINTAIANARDAGVPDDQIAKWTIGALKSQAIAFNNAGVLENLMDKVMIGDMKISELIPQDDIKVVKDQIETNILQKESQSFTMERQRDAQDLEELMQVWEPKIREAAAVKGEFVPATMNISEVPEKFRYKLRQFMDAIARQSNADEINQLQTGFIQSELQGNPNISLIHAISAYTVGGAEGVNQALSIQKSMNDVRSSDPKVLTDLISRGMNGEDMKTLWPSIKDAVESKTLSGYDFNWVLNMSNREASGSEREITNVFNATTEKFLLDLTNVYRDRPEMLDQVFDAAGNSKLELKQSALVDLQRKQLDLQRAFWEDATGPGGYPQALENHKKRVEMLMQTTNADPKTVSDAARRVRLQDTPKPAMATEAIYDNATDGLKDKSTGIALNNIKFFESASDFKSRARFFVDQTKIDLKTPSGARILMEQAEPHGAAAASHAWYEITAAREGEEAARGAVKVFNVIDKKDVELSKLLTSFNNRRAAAAKNGETFFTVSSMMGDSVEYTLDEARGYAEELEYQIKQLQMVRDGVGRREDLRTPEEIQQEITIRTTPSQPRGWFVGNWWDLHVAMPSGQNISSHKVKGNYRNSGLSPYNSTGRPAGKGMTPDPFD